MAERSRCEAGRAPAGRQVGGKRELRNMVIDGYVRVSQVAGRGGDRFISPLVQRQQIEGWANLHGVAVGEVFEELDESGGRADRPLLIRAMERVESGLTQGIVVAKLDRFGRSLKDGLVNIERIEAAGGTFVSVQDGLDLGTPTGKLVLRIMLSMAEWELDRVRGNWDTAKGQAVSRGCFISTWVPLGYVRDDDGHLHPDPEAAPVVAEVFRRRAAGERIADLCRFLNAAELTSAKGNKYFVNTSVSGILQSRAYLGESQNGQHLNTSAHEPLIDAPTWQAAQRPRAVHAVHTEAEPALLTGLLRCASCRLSLASGVGLKGRQTRRYRCCGHSGGGECPDPVRVSAPEIDPLVEDLFFRLLRRKKSSVSVGQTRRTEDALTVAESDLTSYRDDPRFLRTLGAERFERGLRVRRRAVEDALLDLANLERRDAGPTVPSADEIEEQWPSLSMRERCALIRGVIDCVFVAPGDAPVRNRSWVFTLGTAPHDLPRRGLPALEVQPFVPRRGDEARLMLRRPRRWTERRVRRELDVLVGEARRWPTYDSFANAGKARLHEQATMWGGPLWWVRQLDLTVDGPRRTLVGRWDDEKVEAALRPFLKGREEWPHRSEFAAAGLTSLCHQVEHRGGRDSWAERFGITVRDTPGPRLKWTEETVEAALRKITKGRSTYPTPAEFRRRGPPGLYRVASRIGGHRHWRRALGFE